MEPRRLPLPLHLSSLSPKAVRSDSSAYDRYLQSMDGSMRQKVALTAAHLLGTGHVADMGMGSGLGSFFLAALYPRLHVTGVDLDPEVVERAQKAHLLPNLDFRQGDIAQTLFAPKSLDGLFNSSVLHHVTSFGGYFPNLAERALDVQVQQLRDGGVLIVRDFLSPGSGEVLLDLPSGDGLPGDDPRTCSSAHLLERFSWEFRSLHANPGFPLKEMPATDLPKGWKRYQLQKRHAADFLLRKDYRSDWEAEVQEEYTFFTQDDFETCFHRLGLRVLASTPMRNPWICRHRFEGRYAWQDLAGNPLEHPATHILVAGEKVAPQSGVRFRSAGLRPAVNYLEHECHQHIQSGKVFDLARRPYQTLDIIPFFQEAGELYILARLSYPRPIVTRSNALDESRSGGYITEPLNVLITDRPLGQTLEEALWQDARLSADHILEVLDGTRYYPSPGGILEEVLSTFVEVSPSFEEHPLSPRSGFATSGRVGALAALQILRAAQVGALPDARLELNVYQLLKRLGQDPGPWIGEAIDLVENISVQVPQSVVPKGFEDWKPRNKGRCFRRVPVQQSPGFLKIACESFEELNPQDEVLSRQDLEYVIPSPDSHLSENTLALALFIQTGDAIYMAMSQDERPAAQAFSGNAHLLVAPAWRLPKDITRPTQARQWLRDRVQEELGIEGGQIWELGGRYHPSPGLTPEVVFPLAMDVRALTHRPDSLAWVSLDELNANAHHLRDGHLRILVLRAAHALKRMGSAQ